MGKHNAPRKPVIPVILKTGALTIAATSLPVLLAPTAMAAPASSSILDIIAACESGNRNVKNAVSTASGYLQIINGTWRAHGGGEFAPTAMAASRAEQFIVGVRILNGRQGISAWNPSKSCWGSKIKGTTKVEVPTVPPKKVEPKPEVKKKTAPKSAPKPEVKKSVTSAPKTVKKQVAPPTRVTAKKVAKSYLIRKGDTLSGIAKTHGSTVRRLAALNSDTVKNVDLIYAGKKLRLG